MPFKTERQSSRNLEKHSSSHRIFSRWPRSLDIEANGHREKRIQSNADQTRSKGLLIEYIRWQACRLHLDSPVCYTGDRRQRTAAQTPIDRFYFLASFLPFLLINLTRKLESGSEKWSELVDLVSDAGICLVLTHRLAMWWNRARRNAYYTVTDICHENSSRFSDESEW